MGFSVSASTALIFAALFLALGIFYPAMANSYERVQAADADQADRALEQANTDIRVGDIRLDSATGVGNQLELTLINTGSTSLTVGRTDILVGGAYIQRSELDTTVTDVDGNSDPSTDLWLPGETLDVVYNPPGLVGDALDTVSPGQISGTRVRIITEHGVSVSGSI